MPIKLGSRPIILAALLAFAAPAYAAEPAVPDLKAEIDGAIQRMEDSSNGVFKWDGADKMDYRQDGNASVADIVNAHIVVKTPQSKEPNPKKPEPETRILLDHILVRRTPGADNSFDLTVTLPAKAVVHRGDDEVDITFTGATAHAILDAKTERTREISWSFSGARLDVPKSGDWIKSGPLAASYKLSAGADGSWTTPANVELKGVEFFVKDGPVSGTIDRVFADGSAAGPDLAAAERLRDRMQTLQKEHRSAEESGKQFVAMLPDLLSAYSRSEMKFGLAGLKVHDASGRANFALPDASFSFGLSGLSGDSAGLRIAVKEDGLKVDVTFPNAGRVPHRAVFDIELKDVSTAVLRKMAQTAAKAMNDEKSPGNGTAFPQLLGEAAELNPTLRLNDFTYDATELGISANGEATGSPISPKGYQAKADLAVRGIDTWRAFAAGGPFAAYLPLLKEMGTPEKAPDGTPRLAFHLASMPPKLLTINGNDVTAWFAAGRPTPGEPRLLRPDDPPMSGADVTAVQHALAAAKVSAPQNGRYDGETAAAVLRFQKQNSLDANGVVDAATRKKLGVVLPPAGPSGGK